MLIVSPDEPVDFPALLRGALQRSAGGEPPLGLLDELGGWSGVAGGVADLVNSYLLVPLTALVVRDVCRADADVASYCDAIEPLTDAIVATADPGVFGQCVDIVCGCEPVLDVVGKRLGAQLLSIVDRLNHTPIPDRALVELSRAADALEASTRLAVGGYGSRHKLLGALEDIVEPQPRRYAAAAIRSVRAAVDCWPDADDLTAVVRILAGMDPPLQGRGVGEDRADSRRRLAQDIASDASWALANIEIVRALRAPSFVETVDHIESARCLLGPARDDDEREDVAVLDASLEILAQLLSAVTATGSADALQIPALDAEQVGTVVDLIGRYNVAGGGLRNWAGDNKRLELLGWGRLARDLAFLRDQLGRDSLYEAAVVLDDILQIYTAGRSYEIVRSEDDLEGIRKIVQPVIANGLARRAGLLRNLEDHVEALRVRSAVDRRDDATVGDLETAEVLLAAAKRELQEMDSGKSAGGGPTQVLPPSLDELFGGNYAHIEEISRCNPEIVSKIASALDDRRGGRAIVPSLVVTDTCSRIRKMLEPSPDYRSDVAVAVDHVLELLVKFVASRIDAEASRKPYLFNPKANESDLHNDLFDYLTGTLYGSAQIEVPHIGSGRTDIQLLFSGFKLYIELKADKVKTPLDQKVANLKQTAAYQATDPRIGFLMVLRLKAFDPSGPAPHLSACVDHTTLEVQGDRVPRHIVLLALPGNKTAPSAMR